MNSVRGSNSVKRFIWAGLAFNTRKGYQTAIKSYVYFTKFKLINPTWPATASALEEWVALRLEGSTLSMQGQVKPDTMASYLSAIRLWHVDHEYSLAPFDTPKMKLLLQGGRYFYPSIKTTRLPITKDILTALTSIPIENSNDLNLDTAFKVAWAGFLRLGGITYTDTDRNSSSFIDLHLTRSDVTFSKHNQYATLQLKRSKTDTSHTGVLIMLAATSLPTCPVAALWNLITHDLQPPQAPLFAFNNSAFSRRRVVEQLRLRLSALEIFAPHYSGHSFRKRAAQHAADNGMLNDDIQKLGRWSGESFRLYFTTSTQTLYNLNMNFQTGCPVALPRASTA